MALFAIINLTEVLNVVTANSIDDVVESTWAEEVVDVTNLPYRPSAGWGYMGGVFYPPGIPDSHKPYWNGSAFVDLPANLVNLPADTAVAPEPLTPVIEAPKAPKIADLMATVAAEAVKKADDPNKVDA
jgi:hypothetical protein